MPPNTTTNYPIIQTDLACGQQALQDDGQASDDSDSGCLNIFSSSCSPDESDDSSPASDDSSPASDSSPTGRSDSPGISGQLKHLSTSARTASQRPAPYDTCKQECRRRKTQLVSKCRKTGVVQDMKATACALVTYVTNVVSVENFLDFSCVEDAKRLARLTRLMTEDHKLHPFLTMFSHSVSCAGEKNYIHETEHQRNTCQMFQRIRVHVSTAQHPCALMQVYSQLLRLHIDTCANNIVCGLTNCAALFASRQKAGHSVLPRNFQAMERSLAHEVFTALKNAKAIKEDPEAKKDQECQGQQQTVTVKKEYECTGVRDAAHIDSTELNQVGTQNSESSKLISVYESDTVTAADEHDFVLIQSDPIVLCKQETGVEMTDPLATETTVVESENSPMDLSKKCGSIEAVQSEVEPIQAAIIQSTIIHACG